MGSICGSTNDNNTKRQNNTKTPYNNNFENDGNVQKGVRVERTVVTTDVNGKTTTTKTSYYTSQGGNNVFSEIKDNRNNNYSNNNNYSSAGSEQSINEFCNAALKKHNEFRRRHHVPALKLNNDLCRIAQNYAKKIAAINSLQHSDNTYKDEELGENLFWCKGKPIKGEEMTQDWYNEIKAYRWGDFQSGTGHFTQVVWKDSREVGFGFAKASDGGYYGVANYYPAGNYQGCFKENVFRE